MSAGCALIINTRGVRWPTILAQSRLIRAAAIVALPSSLPVAPPRFSSRHARQKHSRGCARAELPLLPPAYRARGCRKDGDRRAGCDVELWADDSLRRAHHMGAGRGIV